ncbi:NAD(P)H-dependent nitrite reductase small subunit [Microbacterium ginsengiterrae]|uniref:NAD(P)H-dependent nitrite reductase small subunit n=1 Tax=Microbacterium ginsengiterrae TaxID=546115 RepID=A0A7W9CEJ2_9MICO|nr:MULTISPECIES: nitrite reductase small subunit NirD [Microbacterium]MBB5744165.1 NAD(P)H-dependent nitrite reductase small subunit [Microbacterium ginsengiterrae]
MTATLRRTATAVRVCGIGDLEVERGRAALIGADQVALFLLDDGSVHAVSNLDPYSGANVISRGIVGTRGDAPTIASPMYKQVFDLRTGACLDTQGKPAHHLAVWQVVRAGDDIHLLPPSTEPVEGN